MHEGGIGHGVGVWPPKKGIVGLVADLPVVDDAAIASDCLGRPLRKQIGIWCIKTNPVRVIMRLGSRPAGGMPQYTEYVDVSGGELAKGPVVIVPIGGVWGALDAIPVHIFAYPGDPTICEQLYAGIDAGRFTQAGGQMGVDAKSGLG